MKYAILVLSLLVAGCGKAPQEPVAAVSQDNDARLQHARNWRAVMQGWSADFGYQETHSGMVKRLDSVDGLREMDAWIRDFERAQDRGDQAAMDRQWAAFVKSVEGFRSKHLARH